MNILVKGTAHVSIGDDLSFMGCQHLLKSLVPDCNVFYYCQRSLKDSWSKVKIKNIDLVIVFGTPVWTGEQVKGLEDFIIDNNIPVIYLGVGMYWGWAERSAQALSNCIGFIARDRYAYKRASQHLDDAVLACCPSVFSFSASPRHGNKTGFIPQYDDHPEDQISFIKSRSPEDLLLICNEIIDFQWCQEQFPDYTIKYSRFFEQMVEYYLLCSQIISHRIHGAHLAYVLGLDVVCTKHKKDKSQTVKQAGIPLISLTDITSESFSRFSQVKRAEFKGIYLKEFQKALQKAGANTRSLDAASVVLDSLMDSRTALMC